jgi:hypothetical protein
MIEDVLMNITSFIPSVGGEPSLPDASLPISYLSSGAGALILGKFTGSVGSLTLPLNYSALLIGTVMANWLLGGIDLPLENQLQQPLLISTIGMVVGAFAMMCWFRNEDSRI